MVCAACKNPCALSVYRSIFMRHPLIWPRDPPNARIARLTVDGPQMSIRLCLM
jgi:hypothetical protein